MGNEALVSGMEIDGFLLEEKVHKGGMASLWRVSRGDIDFPMLMKIPRIRYGDDPAAIAGFEIEQMILPKISGPHVPRFVAAGDFTERPYIVMEYVLGLTLRAQLQALQGKTAEIAQIGAQVATALHDLHTQNVVHLDLKPSNIILRASGEAVLIDFGLAHHAQLPDLLAEEFHLPMGTGAYISPEQVLYVRNDRRSDLFALGVTLYLLMTGSRPFGEPTSVSGLRRRLYVDPVPPRALNPQCPPWMQEVILRCLEVDPVDRYESASQVAFDLRNSEAIALTHRAEKLKKDGWRKTFVRWLRSKELGTQTIETAAPDVEIIPIIMVAVDLSPGNERLAERIRGIVKRFMESERGARLTCVTVRRTPRVGMDLGVDASGESLHVKHLVELKHWARPLEMESDRLSFHVLEAADPAHTLIHYARSNNVEHIIIGARGASTLRRFLGSVSSHVVAEAPCSVTVVRLREEADFTPASLPSGYAGHG